MTQHAAESTVEYPNKSPHPTHSCHHQFIVSLFSVNRQVERAVTGVPDLTTNGLNLCPHDRRHRMPR